MSDRGKGLIVVLDRDYREEDIEPIKELIMQIKGVEAVKDSKVNRDDPINRMRIIGEIKSRIYDALTDL